METKLSKNRECIKSVKSNKNIDNVTKDFEFLDTDKKCITYNALQVALDKNVNFK